MSETTAKEAGLQLGSYLKTQRQRLDPAKLGYAQGPRRTPGLRREEVAQRARVSSTWYTWLEQGRGGMPSGDALDRLAGALDMTAAEREHLFVLAHRRPPEKAYASPRSVGRGVQKILDACETSPAFVKTAASDIVAWNAAASAVLADFGAMPPEQRNLLRSLFLDPHVRTKMPNWARDVRLSVSRFRLEASRVGGGGRIAEVVEKLARESAEFREVWAENAVSVHGEGTKYIVHETAGPIALDYSAFHVDGQPDLTLVVYAPATTQDEDRIRGLLQRLRCDDTPRPTSLVAS